MTIEASPLSKPCPTLKWWKLVKVTGAAKHKKRLKALKSVPREVLQALYLAGQEIELYAEHSITEGSISGKGHVPSAPGEPPNADTRLLDTSIETTVVSVNPPKVEVTSNAPYSVALEYGTVKMAERPFMRPAAKAKRERARQLVQAALDRKARSG